MRFSQYNNNLKNDQDLMVSWVILHYLYYHNRSRRPWKEERNGNKGAKDFLDFIFFLLLSFPNTYTVDFNTIDIEQ